MLICIIVLDQTVPDAAHREGLLKAVERVDTLEAEDVASLAINILENGKSASAWVILNKKIPPYEMQNEMTHENMRKNIK